MQVFADKHDEYKRRHDEIWPKLAETLKDHGASSYAIYLDETRSLLFASVEIESEERWAAVADTEICREWWAFMADVMASNADNSPVSQELKEVFYLP